MRFEFTRIGLEFCISVLGVLMPGRYIRISAGDGMNCLKDGVPYHCNDDEWCVIRY